LKTTVAAQQLAEVTQERFLKEADPAKALAIWWQLAHADRSITSTRQLLGQLTVDIGNIDRLMTDQVNAVLHHPRFQRLEGSWRGVSYLVDHLEDRDTTKIRLLNVSWEALVRDLDRSIEFDQNQLFRKVYSGEFDQPGGEPFAVLIGDYEICLRPERNHQTDDLPALRQIAQVAAAAFCPFITGAHPALFGLDQFSELERLTNLTGVFEQPEYVNWRALRESDDLRFVGLTLPRILMRLPYREDNSRVDRFRFQEAVAKRDDYLWGNAAYAFGAVLLRSYNDSGWLADIRGVRQDVHDGGLVPDLPVDCFETDTWGIGIKSSTDAAILEMLEPLLAELGFMPLSRCHATENVAFFSNASLLKPKVYHEKFASANARLSSMLQYMFCVSRVAHYVKVLGRERIGSLSDPDQCATYLNAWLQQYVLSDDQAPTEDKAQHPLREARVEVAEIPGKPGAFRCVIYLQPHYQFDDVASTFKLTTEMAPVSK